MTARSTRRTRPADATAPVAGAHVAAHDLALRRLAAAQQRYTDGRRAIVDAMLEAGRPLTVPELASQPTTASLPASSVYRNLTVLEEAGVVERLPANGAHARFEIAQDLTGHHHHVVCVDCGLVADVDPSPQLERALRTAATGAAEQTSFEVFDHQLELLGRCGNCPA